MEGWRVKGGGWRVKGGARGSVLRDKSGTAGALKKAAVRNRSFRKNGAWHLPDHYRPEGIPGHNSTKKPFIL
jgi:hypothetical protein